MNDCRPFAPVTDLPDWDPRVGWDEAEEGGPAPDCGHGLWLTASRWAPEHGTPDENGYVKPPNGSRCVGCGQLLKPAYPELIARVVCGEAEHYHCDHCASYLED
jgi:hypothetical protein